ncbi:MAG TPA: hypothetical protein VFG04_08745 [Planctomycetaceae bacterium]|jgi:hypothetical protein|nr:hypothetical protein [Planctomycetaceae bacterium]
MGCLLPLVAVFVPRVVMFFIFLLTNWFTMAYQTVIWPLLGFFFMPYTTLAYMGAMLNNNHEVSGGWLVLVIVAVIVDLGAHERSAKPVYYYRRRK